MAIATSCPKSLEDVERLQSVLEKACQGSHDAAILIFDDVESLDDLTRLLNFLISHTSWIWEEDHVPGPSLGGTNRMGFGLRWIMPDESKSYVLGFGPFGFLPPTRRSPYTALTIPVCSQGKYRPSDPSERHLCDMANEHFGSEEQFYKVWEVTEELKATIVDAVDQDAAKAKITFSLPETCREELNG
ncbi:MAG: hypothetical protein IH991_03215 [Planctomycetes bacterium]|nr:hypothetical protein [Planctomycetota bacterium]